MNPDEATRDVRSDPPSLNPRKFLPAILFVCVVYPFFACLWPAFALGWIFQCLRISFVYGMTLANDLPEHSRAFTDWLKR